MSAGTQSACEIRFAGRSQGDDLAGLILPLPLFDGRPSSGAPLQDAQASQSAILKAALALSVALEDGELTEAEVRANRSTLEAAKGAIEAQLGRLKPRAA